MTHNIGDRVQVDETTFTPDRSFKGYMYQLWPKRDHDLAPPEPKTFPAFVGEVTDRIVTGKGKLAYTVKDGAGNEWFRWASEVHPAAANDNAVLSE